MRAVRIQLQIGGLKVAREKAVPWPPELATWSLVSEPLSKGKANCHRELLETRKPADPGVKRTQNAMRIARAMGC